MRLHQILNPTATTVNLTSKLLFNNGAKLLTIRTLGLDGNTESKDSEPIKLTNFLNTINQVGVINDLEEKKFKPVQQQQQQQPPPTSLNKQQINGNNNLINQVSEPLNMNATVKKPTVNQSQISDEVKVCF
jgi:hypothetical protein